jgi:hypothetical protein
MADDIDKRLSPRVTCGLKASRVLFVVHDRHRDGSCHPKQLVGAFPRIQGGLIRTSDAEGPVGALSWPVSGCIASELVLTYGWVDARVEAGSRSVPVRLLYLIMVRVFGWFVLLVL